MRYAETVQSSLIPDSKSVAVRPMLSYGVVTLLLLISIYALSVQREPDPSQFVSSLMLP
jgi:hypothetical protein